MTTTLRLLGPVVRVQVQRASLKQIDADYKWYDPTPLLEVPQLEVSPDGVVGCQSGTDEPLVDVHNRRHTASKNEGPNGISIGFTSHYASLREQFGAHLIDGVAGENILVAIDRTVVLDDLAGGVVIETSAGERLTFEQIRVAEPCVPFTRYALRYSRDQPADAMVTDSLRSLRQGRRGFYATYPGLPVRIQPGDNVFALSRFA